MKMFGFEHAHWEAGKREARDILIRCAKRKETIAYSELVGDIRSIQLDAHDRRLGHLLGEISSDESAAGRGMLSVIVVHKTGDMLPGPGFFELAEALGRDTSDREKCWVDEVKRVFEAWGRKGQT